MLYFIKNSIGKEFKNFGIITFVAGISMTVSISLIILLVIIINEIIEINENNNRAFSNKLKINKLQEYKLKHNGQIKVNRPKHNNYVDQPMIYTQT